MKNRITLRPAQQLRMSLQKKVLLAGTTLFCGVAAVALVWNLGQSQDSFAETAPKVHVQLASLSGTLAAPAVSKEEKTIATKEARPEAPAQPKDETPVDNEELNKEMAASANTLTFRNENEAMDVISKNLEASPRNYKVFTAKSGSSQIDFQTQYGFQGRPNLSDEDLNELRSASNPVISEGAVEVSKKETAKAAASSAGMRQFEVVKAGGEIEAIKLTKFEVQKKVGKVLLSWSTDFEKYSDYFAVERSSDGKTFTEVGRVNGAGDYSNRLLYTYMDKTYNGEANYYRLRQVDFSGNVKLFPAKKLN